MAEAKKQGAFKRFGSKMAKWFRELRAELKKVIWPTPKQTANNTMVVIIMVLLVGVVISLFSLVSTQLVSLVIGLAK